MRKGREGDREEDGKGEGGRNWDMGKKNGRESEESKRYILSLTQSLLYNVHAVVDSEPAAGSAFMKFRSIQFNLHKFKKKINC